MKIEKISENKLKVTIPVSYFVERNISFENFDYTSPAAQEFFCELMEILENDYGFSFLNSQMVIESDYDKSDDIVFTLTKPSTSQDELSVFQRYLNRKRRNELSSKKKSDNYASNSVVIFEFENFDYLCDFAKKSANPYKGFNSLYKLDEYYYLVLDKRSLYDSSSSEYLLVLLNEYGNKILNSGFYEGYLNEYGNLIILGNALDILEAYLLL